MKYRQIATNFWEDGYVVDLNNLEKTAFIFLFTNHKVNMVGIYELPDKIISSTIGATLEDLCKIKKKFENDRKYFFYNGWIFINNFSEHNKYSPAPNVVKTFLKDFNSIPQEILKYFLIDLKLSFIPSIQKENTVIIRVMVMDKEGTPYLRIEAKTTNEDINPDDIPF